MTEEQKELFKDLCPRLVHGVKVNYYGVPKKVVPNTGSSTHWVGIKTCLYSLHKNNKEPFLPYLRPLDDLTNPITQDGKTFVPIEELRKQFDRVGILIDTDRSAAIEFYSTISCNTIYIGYITQILEKLREWHFDLNDFIKKGLAINVNDLKEDCYA